MDRIKLLGKAGSQLAPRRPGGNSQSGIPGDMRFGKKKLDGTLSDLVLP